MGISRISHKKSGLRYYSNPCFFSLKTLKPSSSSLHSLHQRLSFCSSSSSASPLFYRFDSDTSRKWPYLPSSSFEISSKCHFDKIPRLKEPSFCNSSNGSRSICSSDSILLHKQPSLLSSFCGFSSKCDFETIPAVKEVSFCNYVSGQSSSFHLFRPCSRALESRPALNCSVGGSYRVYSVASSFGMHKPHCRKFSSPSSASSDSWTFDSQKSRKFGDVFGFKQSFKGIDSGGVSSSPNMNSKIIELIKSGNDDMESELRSVGSKLRIESITEIFWDLNHHKISGLRFFRWLRNNDRRWYFSAQVCSRMICNCGCLGDYETMKLLLHEFRSDKICLDENAFSFLPTLVSSQDSLTESVKRLVTLLNKVGGSCCNSGICALIEMFCNSNLFEMAKFVIEITEKKDAYYNILVRQRCKRCHFEEALAIIRELQEPTIKNYNYLLGSLCKNNKITEAHSLVDEMERNGVPPDELTFDILIHNSCTLGKVGVAKQLLGNMLERNLQPRLSSHANFLKAFFKEEQYEEAHNYAVDASVKYKQSSAAIYSLLADLHLGKRDLGGAKNVIVEMMDKGLRPNFRVYIKIVKQLQKMGHGYLASDLQNRYNSF